MTDLTAAESHFRFGENWRRYLDRVDDRAIANAEYGLLALVPADRLKDASFIDIGCGSGLHSLAALRNGAKVIATDIDRDSVAATKELLSRYGFSAEVREQSVFALTGQYDVVYSWGVLHHTGDMWRAVGTAANLVKPGGLFAIALYQKTPFCGVWSAIKRLYSNSPKIVQAPVRWAYTGLVLSRVALGRKNPLRYIRDYPAKRGMNFHIDIHDWLGGYPYESATPDEIIAFFGERGFDLVTDRRAPKAMGLLGAPIGQFTFSRR